MIGKLFNLGGWALVIFCVGTVIAQAFLFSFAWAGGYLSADKAAQFVAIMHGVKLVPEQDATSGATGGRGQVSLDEIIEARTAKSLDLDLREQAIEKGMTDLLNIRVKLSEERRRYDLVRSSFVDELARMKASAADGSLTELQQTLEAIDPKQSKDQILRMLEEGAMQDVVWIMKAMALDKRKKVIAQFKTPEDAEKLADILRQIRLGVPEVTLIDNTQQRLQQFQPKPTTGIQ